MRRPPRSGVSRLSSERAASRLPLTNGPDHAEPLAAAGGIAMINALGNLGGWAGPPLHGVVRDASGSTSLALFCLANGPLIAGIVLMLIGHDRRLEQVPPEKGPRISRSTGPS